jgi:hypothetical protein
MTDETAVQLFWSIALVIVFVLPLIIGAAYVELFAPKSRAWIRRVRGIEAGKRAQGQLRRAARP